jgi:hypothetical protein
MKQQKWIWTLLFITILAVGTGSAAVVNADEGWQATYWNNTDLSGAPVLQRPETVLMNDWGTDSPASGIVEKDYFSARWTRTMTLTPGTYRFMATADDGIRVWVNDELIIDGWQNQARTVYMGYAYADGSALDVRVEYYESQYDAVAQLTWTKVSGSGPLLLDTAVPAANSSLTTYEPTISSWYGEYFNNAYLIGEPTMIRDDAQINFDWGLNSPDPQYSDFDNEHFSARWTQTINLPAGLYQFTATADDGVRLWVDGQLIINQWGHHAGATFTAEIELSGGDVPIRVEYFDDVGLAEIHLDWMEVE